MCIYILIYMHIYIVYIYILFSLLTGCTSKYDLIPPMVVNSDHGTSATPPRGLRYFVT